MKASELRIGNLIFENPNIIGKSSSDIHEVCAADFEHYFDDNKPIPLTEEWLKKFGFRHIGVTEEFSDGFWEYGGFCLSNEFVMLDIDIKVELKHVHQLQNLYFALTGQELTLKETIL